MTAKDVTKTVSGFYNKMDRLVKMKSGTLRFKRLTQGLKCLEQYINVELEDEELPEDFVEHLETLITQSISEDEGREYIEDEQKFDALVTFFKYL